MAVTPVTVRDHLVARMRAASISVVCGLPTSGSIRCWCVCPAMPAFRSCWPGFGEGSQHLADGFARASGKSRCGVCGGTWGDQRH